MNSLILHNMLHKRDELLLTIRSYTYIGLDPSRIIEELSILELEIYVYIKCCMKYSDM